MSDEASPSYLYAVIDVPKMEKMAEFEELTGGEIKVAMMPYTCVDGNGVAETKYVPGITTYEPIVLVHALNIEGQALFNWLKLASAGHTKDAYKNIDIQMLDMTDIKNPSVIWHLFNALPVGISGFTFNQYTQGGVYYVCQELTIKVERIEMEFKD